MSLATNPDATATARQKIDEEIAQLESRILSLKTTRNTLSPIAHLHPEIIQEIFVFASQGSEYGEIGKTSLLITWICHTWRKLAHETTGLWSHIDFFDPTWIETSLSRTQQRPLCFMWFVSGEYGNDFEQPASLCLENLSRIRDLAITPNWDIPSALDWFPLADPLWTTPVPNLVALNLLYISLPSNIFSGTFPSLINLTLDACDFHWASLPIRAGITSLHIRQPVTKTSPNTIVQKLCVVAPELEYLELNKTLIPNAPASSMTSRLGLPKLKSLIRDEEYCPSLASLLNAISAPSSLDQTDLVFPDPHSEQFEAIKAFVSFRGITQWPVEHLELQIQYSSVKVIITEKSRSDVDETDDHDQASTNRQSTKVSLTFHIFRNWNDTHDILDILPLPPIESLSLSGGHFSTEGTASADYFRERRGVKLLNVATTFLPAFAATLKSETSTLSNDGIPLIEEMDDELRNGCLLTLSFHDLTIVCVSGVPGVGCHFKREYYALLKEWLEWRNRAGLRQLEKLVFREMIIPSEEYVATLYQGIVERVECLDVEEKDDEATAMPLTQLILGS
ncbi:hypothetical protein BDN72DRAFT_960958 [Pluteus cervinus]|uniref:Uncharacterized protein n=1 Tax=Pluteus cervinus TaxID=181527 RepID=A0ACD3APP0_9AGAR|nr:hypothetical protein BDN72DRAFT_960958 [Pluteus cervinus]